MKPSTYTIYNASAGSGKTFTLAKSYLKQVLCADSPQYFRHILAITFTNKAVGEMKQRIISMLIAFSKPESLKTPNPMFKAISAELQMPPEQLMQKARHVLWHILHNYGAFDVSTIDGFTHRIIRTFAVDLNLAVNFEVELDAIPLLHEAVDQLISKTGSDKQFTKILVDFAIEKADDGKSWDISFDFNNIAKLLIYDTNIEALKHIGDKNLEDFKQLKQHLNALIATTESAIQTEADLAVTLIMASGLEFSDFSRSSYPNHFKKLADLDLTVSFDAAWHSKVEQGVLYNAKTAPDIIDTIEAIQPELFVYYSNTKANIFKLKLCKAIYKNITSLSVLSFIKKELDLIKAEKNVLLISEFNQLISTQIKNQPAPFIYERLGEKFKHYYIDEFQDTSTLQWQNLTPLLTNALAAEGGSVLLVGDAKQAIYRWRGGEAEQFMNLYNGTENPFKTSAPKVLPLATNYRSFKAVVDYNNSLFQFLGDTFFDKTSYTDLYKKAPQELKNFDSGFVHINFLDIEKEDNKDDLYGEVVLNSINQCKAKGHPLGDICILVRKRKHGVALAEYLTANSIKISSSETLLLTNSSKVIVILAVLHMLKTPNEVIKHLQVLNYLADHLEIADKHSFYKQYLSVNTTEFLKNIIHLDVEINSTLAKRMPFYELVEYILRAFNMHHKSDAYLQFFLDEVLLFSQKHGSDISGFLEYFDAQKNKLSIVTPNTNNAVRIMTIHKSKGLEFPIVIFPYAEQDIYQQIDAKLWMPLPEHRFAGFKNALINYNKDISQYNTTGELLYQQRQNELQLDSINLLYVALTRAEKGLFICSKLDISSKGIVNDKSYAGVLIKHLQHIGKWQDGTLDYHFGVFNNYQVTDNHDVSLEVIPLVSSAKETHNINIVTTSGQLWHTNRTDAVAYGNLVHLILSKIKTTEDIDTAISALVKQGVILQSKESQLYETVHNVVNHHILKPYFTKTYTVYNEHDIYTAKGDSIRPDRLVIDENKNAVIIDYKTGEISPDHKSQLQHYASIIQHMGFTITNMFIVYINSTVTVTNV